MTTKKKVPKTKQNIPAITLQPKQLEYVNANQSIVFFGGGAKLRNTGSTLKTPL